MTKNIKKPIFTFMAGFTSLILLAGCVVHVGAGESDNHASSWSSGKDYSEVNKSIKISEGKSVGNVSTVNGSLHLGDKVSAEKVSSVNGRLKVGDNVTVEGLSTVNGGLSAGEGLRAEDNVSTVNGSIKLHENSQVGGTVSTVNGSINLEGVIIGQNIETVNGSISLEDNTIVKGDITYRWNKKNNYNRKDPVLRIDASSTVEGNIYLERQVELDFADESLKSKVIEKFDE